MIRVVKYSKISTYYFPDCREITGNELYTIDISRVPQLIKYSKNSAKLSFRPGLKIQEIYLSQRRKIDQFINTYDPSPLPIKRMKLQNKFLIGFNQGMTQFFDGN